MDAEIEMHIRNNIEWAKLPKDISQNFPKSEYDKRVLEFSIKNQFRYRANLVRFIAKNEKQYYKELLQYSADHLMLFPYHLSDFIVAGMRITPFQYYLNIIQRMLADEKNYDTLPNFTAADCLRLLGIGRNQYLEIMIKYRAKKFFSLLKKPNRELLPVRPVRSILIEPWWILNPGYITEDDIRYMTTGSERHIIDRLVQEQSFGTLGPLLAGQVDQEDVKNLYLKGLIYLDVPIEDEDRIVVPPLEGFVMNRVTGDYFETLLYKIFISIDEKTTVKELSEMLKIDLSLVKNAISMYCRLGFAYKKTVLNCDDFHASWNELIVTANLLKCSPGQVSNEELIQFMDNLANDNDDCYEIYTSVDNFGSPGEKGPASPPRKSIQLNRESSVSTNLAFNTSGEKRIALLYDSTLAAFLMMGNLSPNLKTHAVTMFEVGKLLDESLDVLLGELNQINECDVGEDGFEAEIYFLHAILLCKTILFLRKNPKLKIPDNIDENFSGLGLDLIRCESLLALEEDILQKLLYKNYAAIFSLCPLSNETKMISSFSNDLPLPHFSPISPLMNSVWFKLFLYHQTKFGPPTLLLTRGYRLCTFPLELFGQFENLLITPFSKDSLVVNVGNALETINDYLQHSALLVQAYSDKNSHFNTNRSIKNGNLHNEESTENQEKEIFYVPLPLQPQVNELTIEKNIQTHPAIKCLNSVVDLKRSSGFVRMIKHPAFNLDDQFKEEKNSNFIYLDTQHKEWTLLDVHFGIPLFDRDLNRKVCSNIENANLCDANNLKEVIKWNAKLQKELVEFVHNFTVEIDTNKQCIAQEGLAQMQVMRQNCRLTPPSTNLVFMNGTLSRFD